MPPRKKMPPRPSKKKPVKPKKPKATLMPITKPAPKAKTMPAKVKPVKPKKEESLGKKVGSRPRREINKRRQMEKDLLDDL